MLLVECINVETYLGLTRFAPVALVKYLCRETYAPAILQQHKILNAAAPYHKVYVILIFHILDSCGN